MQPQPARKHEDSRRGFIRGSSLLLAGAFPGAAIASQALGDAAVTQATPLRVGLIGCGFRGVALAAEALANQQVPTKLTAMADLFPDRVQQALRTLRGKFGDQVQVEPGMRCLGLDSHQRLLDSPVDVVLLATPPAFIPVHLEATIQAGKHVYAERPVAVDPPGVRRFLDSADLAASQGIVISVDTGYRLDSCILQTMQQLSSGVLGRLLFARAYSYASVPKSVARHKSQSDLEFQLRNWQQYCWASGDAVVANHVHNLDLINCLVGATPLQAHGFSGRALGAHNGLGTSAEHQAQEFTYPGGFMLFSACRQSAQPRPSVITLHGTDGWCDLVAGRIYSSQNQLVWQADQPTRPRVESRLDAMFDSLRALPGIASSTPGKLGISTESQHAVQWAADSTLTAILGRTAGQQSKTVKWNECLQSTNSLSDIERLCRLSDSPPVET